MAGFLGISDETWGTEWVKRSLKQLVYVVFILYFIMMFTMISKDSNALDPTQNAMYIVAVLFPLVVFAYFIFSNVEDKKYLWILVAMVFLLLGILFRSLFPSFDDILKSIGRWFVDFTEMKPFSKSGSFLVTIASKFLLLAIGLVFLSIVFNVGFNESFRQRGRLGTMLYALWFIPCMISDYLRYLFVELKTTPRVVFALLLIEIILIALYFALPRWFNEVILPESNRILKEPMFLYGQKEIADAEAFFNVTDTQLQLQRLFQIKDSDKTQDAPVESLMRNYSISMWVTVNAPDMPDDKECMVFRVGSNGSTTYDPDLPRYGAPYLACKGSSKMRMVLSNKYPVQRVNEENSDDDEDDSAYQVRVYDFENDATTELEMPYQRWNFIVFNYNGSRADVFVNGELMVSKNLGEFMPSQTHDNKVCVGSDTKQIHGAVCEVRIHKEPLGQTEIAQTYNLLKLMNPPIYNLS